MQRTFLLLFQEREVGLEIPIDSTKAQTTRRKEEGDEEPVIDEKDQSKAGSTGILLNPKSLSESKFKRRSVQWLASEESLYKEWIDPLSLFSADTFLEAEKCDVA